MSTISVYSFRDDDDNEETFTTQDYREAVEFAEKGHFLIIDNEYEWSDSAPVASYRLNPTEPVIGLEDGS